MDLLEKRAMWVLGYLADAQLSEEVGINALASGMDSNDIRILSSLMPGEEYEARCVFNRILKAYNIPDLGKPAAALIFAKSVARKIINIEVTPYEGARKMWEISVKVGDVNFHELDTFIYAASEMEDRPEDESFFAAEIVKCAVDFVN